MQGESLVHMFEAWWANHNSLGLQTTKFTNKARQKRRVVQHKLFDQLNGHTITHTTRTTHVQGQTTTLDIKTLISHFNKLNQPPRICLTNVVHMQGKSFLHMCETWWANRNLF